MRCLQIRDVRGCAEFGFREILQAFRAVSVHMPHGCHPGGFNRVALLEPSSSYNRKKHRARQAEEDDGSESAVYLLTTGEKGPMKLFCELAEYLVVGAWG